MKPTDQVVKLQIVLITAVLSLVGFLLEVGPVGVFPLVSIGLALELPTLGFLPYLALAASAAIGLHLPEQEPTLKEKPPEPTTTPLKATSEGEMAEGQVRTRVRPELHQSRMVVTAMGGFIVLKGLNLAMMWPLTASSGITFEQLTRAFEFGFIFMSVAWMIMWQFLRWFAQRKRWIRLQDELIGADINRIMAVVVLLRPLLYFGAAFFRGFPYVSPLLTTLLELSVAAIAVLLWFARPLTLRRTITGLLIVEGVILLLTVALVIVERGYVAPGLRG